MGLHFRLNDAGTSVSKGVVAHAAALNLTDWTIEACLRVETQPASGQVQDILNKGDGAGNDDGPYYLAYENSGGTLRIRAGYWDGAANQIAVRNVTLTPGVWYSVAAAHDDTAGTIDIYLALRQGVADDARISGYGAATQTTGLTGSPAGNTGDVIFGAGFVSQGGGFSLSELRLWSTVRTSSQLDAAVATRLRGNESGLVAYWPMDDGPSGISAAIVYDRGGDSTASYDATLFNRPDWTDDPIDLFYPVGDFYGAQSGLFCYPSWTLSRGVAITASCASAAGYPLTNLRNGKQALQWRNDGTLSYNIVFDFGRPRSIGMFSAENWRGTSASEITVQLHSADSWGAPAVSETVLFSKKKLRHVFTRPGEYRYARLLVVDAGADSSIHGMGCAHWWHVTELQRQPQMEGETYPISDPSEAQLLPHYGRVSRTLATSADGRFSLPDQRKGLALHLRRLLREGGGMQPCYLVSDLARRLYVGDVYGFLRELPRERLADMAWTHTAIEGIGIVGDRS
ncbi:MAG: LamG-like jellyroll fold domain-containing protein [Candidatus Nanopelagicales bacterium]|nr:LamG-like jellyroll fold domain-containing protein [Candidatus Nanopelagicales bacterium]